MATDTLKIQNPFSVSERCRTGSRANVIVSPLPETYSQFGEDLIIAATLEALMIRSGRSVMRYIDIGANHPIEISNTYLFYRKYGGRGTLFEADPERIGELERVRPLDDVVHAAITDSRDTERVQLHICNASECSSLHANCDVARMGLEMVATTEVPGLHIMDALESCWPAGPVHLLSIDIEGSDLAVLSATDFTRYRPWIICAEISLVEYAQDTVNTLTAAGYMFQAVTPCNAIFVDTKRL